MIVMKLHFQLLVENLKTTTLEQKLNELSISISFRFICDIKRPKIIELYIIKTIRYFECNKITSYD